MLVSIDDKFSLCSSNSSNELDTNLVNKSIFVSSSSICAELACPAEDLATALSCSATSLPTVASSPVFVFSSSWSTAVKPKSLISLINCFLEIFSKSIDVMFLLH